ncbi:MAG: hypothetical protein PVI21_01220 [Candidatus Woesebacteria bacterium]|jgi:hypothetical protein
MTRYEFRSDGHNAKKGRPIKEEELFTNSSSPLYLLWQLFENRAQRVIVRDGLGWRYVFEQTDALAARANYVNGLHIVDRPRTMVAERIVRVTQVLVGRTSGNPGSFCFDIGPWRTGALHEYSIMCG